jgi:putative sterol carrier protein
MPKGWRWDDDSQRRVRADQDPTGETLTDAEKERRNKAIKAEMAERLRELEYRKQKYDVQEMFKKARELRERGVNYRDLFGDGAYATKQD